MTFQATRKCMKAWVHSQDGLLSKRKLKFFEYFLYEESELSHIFSGEGLNEFYLGDFSFGSIFYNLREIEAKLPEFIQEYFKGSKDEIKIILGSRPVP